MPSPFAATKPWQDAVLKLATKWYTSGTPTKEDWDIWTQAVYEAHLDKEASGWDGDDPLWQEALAVGINSRDEEVDDLHLKWMHGP